MKCMSMQKKYENDFRGFVMSELSGGMLPQVKFLEDNQRRSLVSYVGRYETFVPNVQYILNTVGLPSDLIKKLKHHNKTNRKPYRAMFNTVPDLIKPVERAFHRDMLYGGYEY